MDSAPETPSTPELPPVPTVPTPAAMTAEERQLGMFCHLAGLAGYVIPMGNILGPLILWLLKREQMPFVASEGKESLNFQISITLYVLVSVALTFVCIGFFTLMAVLVFDIIVVILACVDAQKGKAYRYPLCIRFIS